METCTSLGKLFCVYFPECGENDLFCHFYSMNFVLITLSLHFTLHLRTDNIFYILRWV